MPPLTASSSPLPITTAVGASDCACAARRALLREPGARLGGEPLLAALLLGLELRDLAADRGEHAAAGSRAGPRSSAAPRRVPRRPAAGRRARATRRSLRAITSARKRLTSPTTRASWLPTRSIVSSRSIRVVHALRAEQRPRAPRARRRSRTATRAAATRCSLAFRRLPRATPSSRVFVLELRLQPVELDVREVVALDRLVELHVDQVDLLQNLLRLGLLGLDLGRVRRRRADAEEDRRDQDEECRCVSSLRADDGSPKTGRRAPRAPRRSHKLGTLANPRRRAEPTTEAGFVPIRITGPHKRAPSVTVPGLVRKGTRCISAPLLAVCAAFCVAVVAPAGHGAEGPGSTRHRRSAALELYALEMELAERATASRR